MRTFFLLALGLLLVPVASAQSPEKLSDGPVVEKLGNFEIQDFKIEIDYDETRRGRTRATVTVRSPKGFADAASPYLLRAATSNGRTAQIPLRATDDGTLTGTGTLPTLGNTTELTLMMNRDEGFRFGIPVYDQRTGWNIAEDSAWKFEEGAPLMGSAEGEGWRVDISMDWPLDVDITIEG